MNWCIRIFLNNFRSHHQRFSIHKNLSLSIFYCAITNTIINGFSSKGNWTLGEYCNCVICDIFLAFYVFICQIHMRKKGDDKNVEQGWDTHAVKIDWKAINITLRKLNWIGTINRVGVRLNTAMRWRNCA